MSKSGREKHLTYSLLRRRQEAANNRRFCIIWINRMVNKQVQKRIEGLRSEFLVRSDALRDEMMTELHEQLKELVTKDAREKSHYTKLDREPSMRSRLLGKMEEHKKNAKENDSETKLVHLDTPSHNSSEKTSDTHKPLKCEREEILKILLEIFCDGETNSVHNDADTSSRPANCEPGEIVKILLDVFCDDDTSSKASDADTSSRKVIFGQEENQGNSSDVSIVANTSQLREDLEEEERSRTQELRFEAENVKMDTKKEEQVSLMERQWKEWMDKQEMRGNGNKIRLQVDQQKTEKQEGAATPAPKKQTEQNVQRGHNVMKIKAYFSDLLKNPFPSYKWERLDDED
ncbi:uncharacterized protein LOC130169441 [Seriola aureovittata]|uniref:uncharacterized protein LOC130169441 n=1 Tax=Seriola aureovittata TaxID=2871759 RepID=UPI0024BEBE6D|nr:uncharacterized protein LOC130169441 [Seriola aureovittata]XP_056232181.1 uncharacterized protein LOC130169441 [Seriola aureovittata]